MGKVHFDHVAFLVKDLETAVSDYRQIFSAFGSLEDYEVVWDEGIVEGFRVRWATFVRHHGETVLQFLQSELPRDKKLIAERGECIHHLAFHSTDVAETEQKLRNADIPLANPSLTNPDDKPWLRWNFITPQKAHGVLIEVAQAYDVKDLKWVPAEAK